MKRCGVAVLLKLYGCGIFASFAFFVDKCSSCDPVVLQMK